MKVKMGLVKVKMMVVKVMKGHNQLWQVVTTTWFSWMRKMRVV